MMRRLMSFALAATMLLTLILGTTETVFANSSFKVLVTYRTTYAYSRPTMKSERLVLLKAGQVLTVAPHSKYYYKSTLTVNSKRVTSYIRIKAVQKILPEVSNKYIPKSAPSVLKAYEAPNGLTKVLKTYTAGYVNTFTRVTADWFKATPTINGKKTTVYVKRSAMLLVLKPVNKTAIARLSSFKARIRPNSSLTASKSLKRGTTYTVIPFAGNWYKILDGGNTYYVFKSSLDMRVPAVTKFGTNKTKQITAYTTASTTKKVFATWPKNTVLRLTTHSELWLRATVTAAGETRTAYVPRSDISFVSSGPSTNPTGRAPVVADSSYFWVSSTSAPAYSSKSTKSIAYKSYPMGAILPVSSTSEGWYASKILVDGVTKTAYFSSAHVVPFAGNRKIILDGTRYDITLTDAIKWQKVGRTTSTAAKVKDYLDPNHFGLDSGNALQFLKLSKSSGVSATNLNKLLVGKGVLAGEGQAFVDAGKKYSINEVYLIAHARLETGNGTSTLSKGVWYAPKLDRVYVKNSSGSTYKYTAWFAGTNKKTEGRNTLPSDAVKVYNMYGYGAFDTNPTYGGGAYAYEKGWTSVSKAIVGGANNVRYYYIDARSATLSGQDTLYKMLWHPEAMEMYKERHWHQYATDVGWAVKQSVMLREMYNTLSTYTLELDIPKYK